MATEEYEPHPIWDRELTILEEKQIKEMMELNPVIDRLIAETIIKMPPDRLKEICDNHINNPREPEPPRILTEEECHNCRIYTEEEQKEEELRHALKAEEYKLKMVKLDEEIEI